MYIVKAWKGSSALIEKGLLLRAASNSTYAYFASSEYSRTDLRPYLTINYSQNGLYKIQNTATGKYLNITSSGSATMKSNSQLLEQYFRMYYNSSNHSDRIYLLSSDYGTNKLMSENNSTVTSSASNNLNWNFVAQTDGTFLIMNTSTSNYLTESSGSVRMEARDTSANQTWTLEVQDSYDVTVNVKNSPGKLIENSYIEILTEGYPDNRQTVILSSGTITITMLDRAHGINAGAAGCAEQYYPTVTSSASTLNFTLISKSTYPTLGWPIIGSSVRGTRYISSKYGYRCYKGTNNYPAVHKGVDLYYSTITNEQIKSVSAGTVTFSGWLNGAGYVVRVKFSYTGTTYYVSYKHLAEQSTLCVGDAVVSDSTIIGKVGNTYEVGKNDMTPHLHIDFYYLDSYGNAVYIDPRAFFED